MRHPHRVAAVAVAALAIGVSLVVIPMHRAIGAPTPETAELIIQKGGDRTGSQTIAGLADTVFDFFAGTSGSPPGPGDVPTDSCTTHADGRCSVNVAGRTGGGQGYWIRERTAPSGFSILPILDVGTTSSNTGPVAYNQLFTGRVANNNTYEFPMAQTGDAKDARGSYWADARDNPPLPPKCGLNVALLIDTSASIGSDIGNVKNAAKGFVDALTGTPSQIALYSFATNASTRLGLTPVSTQSGATTVKNAVNALPNPSGSTNWDQGLYNIAADTTKYDAVIMLTDGNPTVYGPPPAEGPGNHTRFREVENGIFSANQLKAEGTRVVVVGVGSGVTGSTENLKSISGPVAGSDYFQTDYEKLGELFRELALATCQGTVSVVKQVIPPNGTIADAEPAGGWTFTTSTSGVTPTSGDTDPATGGVNFSATLGGKPSVPVTLTETLKPDYVLEQVANHNAACSKSDGSPVTVTDSGTLGFTVDALATDAVTCVVYNRAPDPQASVIVNKTWVINGTTYKDGKQPSNFQAALELTGQVEPEFGTEYTGYVAEHTVTTGEHLDNTLLPPGCSNHATGDIGDQTLRRGTNTFEITNTVTCVTTLTLRKHVVNPYGDPADPNLWTLTATAEDSSQTFNGTTGVKADVKAGLRYDLTESDVKGYAQEVAPGSDIGRDDSGSWRCVLVGPGGLTGPEFRGLDGNVIVDIGQNAECSATNVAQPATITLLKTVHNTHGGTAVNTDWTLKGTPNSTDTGAKTFSGKQGDDSVTNATIVPLVGYALTENGPDGYVQVGEPDCIAEDQSHVAMDGNVLSPALGQVLTCTYTNNDVEPTPTTPPPTSPPPTSPPPTSPPPTSPPPTSPPPTSAPPTSAPPSSTSPPLPPTGTSFGPIAGAGVGTFLVGAALLVFALRRRRRMLEDI